MVVVVIGLGQKSLHGGSGRRARGMVARALLVVVFVGSLWQWLFG